MIFFHVLVFNSGCFIIVFLDADRRWNWHNCCGALDGKHIRIKKPHNSGSLYYNYKGFFSVVLLALVDGDYKFIWAHVGSNGSSSDCGIFNESELETGLRERTVGFPDPRPFPHDDRPIPYALVGDDAFPLRTFLMKPYSARYLTHDERIFNYRCSRARRVIENAFGILVSRLRCLLSTIATSPTTVRKIVKACLCLHTTLCASGSPTCRMPTLTWRTTTATSFLVPGGMQTSCRKRKKLCVLLD